MSLSGLKVRLGDADGSRNTKAGRYTEMQISGWNIHPNYYSGTLDNNIAVFWVQAPINPDSM